MGSIGTRKEMRMSARIWIPRKEKEINLYEIESLELRAKIKKEEISLGTFRSFEKAKNYITRIMALMKA
jgi:hypothetical protein